ncbi:MAG: hypothetical protein LRS43_03460 [Desulfurococcales archaeon]|nr:hypothetical protein [Desulfurococcales archaeon]
MGTGIAVIDERGSKIGGCAGIRLASTIWAEVEYKSVLSGGVERMEGLVDYVIACVSLGDGSVIGYMIQPKSITVAGPGDLPKSLGEKARSKIAAAIEKARGHVEANYGITPVKYRVKGVEDSTLYIIAYLDWKPDNSNKTLYDVEAVVFEFNYENLSIINAYRETITIVDTSNLNGQ